MSRKPKVTTLKDTEARPSRPWDDLIGFEGVDATLYQLWREQRLPQVVVLEGRAGIGKRKFMAKLVARFFCETHTSCGQCEGCHSVEQGYQGDLFWLETDGTIKVAEAEGLQDHLSYQAQAAPRIAVIIDVETLNDQASNRLLKLLEEPPAGTLIFATCSRFDKLLPTIRSRAVRWRVHPPPLERSAALIRSKIEGAGEADIQQALVMFGLSIGRALAYLEQSSPERKARLERLQRLLLLPMKGEHLKEIQDILKELAWKAPELAQFFELALNQSYRRILSTTRETSVQDFRRIKHWRKILSQVYRAGGVSQNYLNVQLVAEALMSPIEV